MSTDTQNTNTDTDAKALALREMLQNSMYAYVRRDTEARSDLHLREIMLDVIERLALVVRDAAADLTEAKGRSGVGSRDTFAVDKNADLIVWQLIEFLSQAQIPRDEEWGEVIVKAHQLTPEHAGFWFNVG